MSKLTRKSYTLNGIPILEVQVAISQKFLEKTSIGYLWVILAGELLQTCFEELRIGRNVEINATIWQRKYKKDLSEHIVDEVKFIAEKIQFH